MTPVFASLPKASAALAFAFSAALKGFKPQSRRLSASGFRWSVVPIGASSFAGAVR